MNVNIQTKERSPANLERRMEAKRRLEIIEGQVRGIREMIDSDRECVDIATQAAAALQGLRGVTKIILRNYMEDCLEVPEPGFDKGQTYDDFLEVFYKFVK